jgi:hypothetical protein
MPLALGRRVSQFPVVVEERLVLARLAVDVTVPLVEGRTPVPPEDALDCAASLCFSDPTL